jgi:hypothetical protein
MEAVGSIAGLGVTGKISASLHLVLCPIPGIAGESKGESQNRQGCLLPFGVIEILRSNREEISGPRVIVQTFK